MVMIGLTAIVLSVLLELLRCTMLLALTNRWYGCFSTMIGSGTSFSGLIYDVTHTRTCYIGLLSIYATFICLWLPRVYFCGNVSWFRTNKTNADVLFLALMYQVSDYHDCTLIARQNIRSSLLQRYRWKFSWHSLLSNRFYIFTCWSFASLFFFRNQWWNPGVNPYVYYVHV